MAPLARPDAHRFQRRLLAASALGLSLGLHMQAFANPFGTAPVSDQALNNIRGGFDLPNGMKVAVGVEIATYVDRSLALRTILNVSDRTHSGLEITVPSAAKYGLANPIVQNAASPTIVVATPGQPDAAMNAPATETPSSTTPPAISAPLLSITAGTDPATIPKIEIPSDLGAVTIEQSNAGAAVVLKGPDLEIQHVAGNATGVLIANTMDNRVIDTVATVNISLSDSAIPVGNIMLRIESVVLDAVGRNVY